MTPCDNNRNIPDGEVSPFFPSSILLPLVFFCLTWITLISSPGLARSADQETTLFLPLKINAAIDVEHLQELADKTVAATLAERHLATAGYSLMPRPEAMQQIDYQGAFPPSFEVIQILAAKYGNPR
jgi:hypothetical protein